MSGMFTYIYHKQLNVGKNIYIYILYIYTVHASHGYVYNHNQLELNPTSDVPKYGRTVGGYNNPYLFTY